MSRNGSAPDRDQHDDDDDDLETRAVAALRRSLPGPLDRRHGHGNYGALVRARFANQETKGVLFDDLCKLLAPLAVRAVLDHAEDPATLVRLLRAQPEAAAPAWIVAALIDSALQRRDEVRALRAELAELKGHKQAGPPAQWGGDWQEGATYPATSFVRHRSHLWWALKETTARPGDDFESWTMVVRGAHGGKPKP